MVEVMKIMAASFNRSHACAAALSAPNPAAGHVGPPKMDGSWWRVLTKRGPLEKGMANHFNSLAFRTP